MWLSRWLVILPRPSSSIFPETGAEIEFTGRVAWSNREGEHGVQFVEMPAAARANLQRWLQSRMEAGA